MKTPKITIINKHGKYYLKINTKKIA